MENLFGCKNIIFNENENDFVNYKMFMLLKCVEIFITPLKWCNSYDYDAEYKRIPCECAHPVIFFFMSDWFYALKLWIIGNFVENVGSKSVYLLDKIVD